ncbi:MAG: Molybdenum cofactor synthesis domain protein [Pedosphaera sp.]|nr:Molybdenum cofactor synthesis domain protein [Pedosphaera sp.]
MLELEAALDLILALIPAAQPELVPLGEAHGRILAERILSTVDLPGFDNSSMDGYAVRAADLQGAGGDTPVALQLSGRVAAGETSGEEVAAGKCIRLFTGSPLPRGADAVVMQEDTRMDAANAGTVWFLDSVKPWENVRFCGEDLKRGAALGEAGDALTAGRISLLAAGGLAKVAVGRQPVAGLLASGSELLEPGEPLAAGKIYESNRLGLAALAHGVGAVPKIFPLVADTLDGTRNALEQAFEECDLVVTTGGVSVGEMDFIKAAFEQLGGELQFWKVAIKPGRPFVFGRWREKFLFGLPGNPVSAFVTFLLLVRPALARWQGARNVTLPAYTGMLAEAFSNPGDRRHFMRVTVDGSGNVRSAGTQASHIMGSLATANGLVDVPPKTSLPTGAMVRVLRWE